MSESHTWLLSYGQQRYRFLSLQQVPLDSAGLQDNTLRVWSTPASLVPIIVPRHIVATPTYLTELTNAKYFTLEVYSKEIRRGNVHICLKKWKKSSQRRWHLNRALKEDSVRRRWRGTEQREWQSKRHRRMKDHAVSCSGTWPVSRICDWWHSGFLSF